MPGIQWCFKLILVHVSLQSVRRCQPYKPLSGHLTLKLQVLLANQNSEGGKKMHITENVKTLLSPIATTSAHCKKKSKLNDFFFNIVVESKTHLGDAVTHLHSARKGPLSRKRPSTPKTLGTHLRRAVWCTKSEVTVEIRGTPGQHWMWKQSPAYQVHILNNSKACVSEISSAKQRGKRG